MNNFDIMQLDAYRELKKTPAELRQALENYKKEHDQLEQYKIFGTPIELEIMMESVAKLEQEKSCLAYHNTCLQTDIEYYQSQLATRV